jgi:hypothetical protein
MDVDDSSDAMSLHQKSETQRLNTLRGIGKKLKEKTQRKQEKQDERSKDEIEKKQRGKNGSDEEASGDSGQNSDQEAFTVAPVWHGAADDDEDLFDTSRQNLKRKRESSAADLESPSKRVKIRHQQKQQGGDGSNAPAKSNAGARQNFIKMVRSRIFEPEYLAIPEISSIFLAV